MIIVNKENLKRAISEAFGNWAAEFEVNGKKIDSKQAWADYLAVTHMACLLTQMEKQIELLTGSKVLDLSYTADGKKLINELKKVNTACGNAHKYITSLNRTLAIEFKDMTYDVWSQAFKNMKDYAAKL